MIEKRPLVSVLLLSMNHEKFIKNCIESIENQTYKNIEIIYLDNASIDNTFKIAKETLEKNELPHKVFRNNESRGISKNFNFLYHNSQGLYLLPLSTDDWLTENSIEEKISFLLEHPEYGMVYSSCYHYKDSDSTVSVTPYKKRFKQGWVLSEILKNDFIRTVGSVIRRSTLDVVGDFDEDSNIEDLDMWIRIAEKFPIGYIDKELGYYRIKTGNNLSSNSEYMFSGSDYIINKYSHYKEMKGIKRKMIFVKLYYQLTKIPVFRPLIFILRYFRNKIS